MLLLRLMQLRVLQGNLEIETVMIHLPIWKHVPVLANLEFCLKAKLDVLRRELLQTLVLLKMWLHLQLWYQLISILFFRLCFL
jgi:hypothetical protein